MHTENPCKVILDTLADSPDVEEHKLLGERPLRKRGRKDRGGRERGREAERKKEEIRERK